MHNTTTIKALTSLGSALAASRAARSISSIQANDVLGLVGLQRRRNHFWENVALVGAGAIVGAAGAILLAPASGRDTRRRIADEVSRLGDEASRKVDETKQNLLNQARESLPNNGGAFQPAAAERNV
jgi:hypothetical protein